MKKLTRRSTNLRNNTGAPPSVRFVLASAVFLVAVAGSGDDGDGTPVITADDAVTHEGHLKPFGSVGPYLHVDEFLGFPKPIDFFTNYVFQKRPLKMTEAAKLSKAFARWTDEYFLSLNTGSSEVTVETGKKENRINPVMRMNFLDFISEYNKTDCYMVDSMPDFIRKDVMLPGPLQCQQIYEEMLVENIFWMSSGGTSSVVHTDSVDNIICSFRGEKRFILINPSMYRQDVDIDHPEGAYSGIDVDHVNLTQYPGLMHVSYHAVDLQPGDCLYIPFKWIHQVRSYGSNIAVNIWWSNQKSKNLALQRCPDDLDPDLTLDKVAFYGFAPITDDMDTLKDHFVDLVQREMTFDRFVALFNVDGDFNSVDSHLMPLRMIFLIIDKNRDKLVSPNELDQISEKEWEMVQRQMDRFDQVMEEMEAPDATLHTPFARDEL